MRGADEQSEMFTCMSLEQPIFVTHSLRAVRVLVNESLSMSWDFDRVYAVRWGVESV